MLAVLGTHVNTSLWLKFSWPRIKFSSENSKGKTLRRAKREGEAHF